MSGLRLLSHEKGFAILGLQTGGGYGDLHTKERVGITNYRKWHEICGALFSTIEHGPGKNVNKLPRKETTPL